MLLLRSMAVAVLLFTTGAAAGGDLSLPADDTTATIDVLGLYTPLAQQRLGGLAQATAALRNAIDETNRVLSNSRIDAVVRLVGIERVEYVETPNPADFVPDREWVSHDPAVLALRKRYHADTVALLTEIPNGVSTVARGEALSILKRNTGALHATLSATVDTASVVSLVLAHEVGHTLGGDHDLGDPVAAARTAMNLTPEAHDISLPSRKMFTILASGCSGCSRVPYYSSPDIVFNGAILGAVGSADNSALFRFTAPVMASYSNEVGAAGFFEFETDPLAVVDVEGQATIRVARNGGAAGAVSVEYRTVELPNEARSGADFGPVQGRLEWADGDDAVKTFTVPVLANPDAAPERLVALQLRRPDGGAVLNHGSLALLSILRADRSRAAGYVEFTAPQFAASGEVASVTARRVGGNAGALSTRIYALEGSAELGLDFDFSYAVLGWSDGDTGTRTFTIPIHRRAGVSGECTVKLRFNAEPSSLGRQPSAILRIAAPPAPSRRRAVAPP